MQQMIWFTPEGIEDLLPSQAVKLEYYRRQLLNEFQQAGYGLVLTPIAEFTDSLLTGTGKNQATDLCRFTDQESGKMMGVRADVTPQVARIVSNRIKPTPEQLPVRLCYAAEVLKTRNNKAKGSRSPIQVGVELFGVQQVEADIEVMELMLDALLHNGVAPLTLSVGHVGIVNALMTMAEFSESDQAQLVDILQRKAVPEYEAFISEANLSPSLRTVFESLLSLSGSASDVLPGAEALLTELSIDLAKAVADLQAVAAHFAPDASIKLVIDLTELRGYNYHTGLIFGCYARSHPLYLMAKGGRYDGVGAQFGQDLPATGFSMDLRGALDILPEPIASEEASTIYAPCCSNVDLKKTVELLKAEGMRVIRTYDQKTLSKGSLLLTEVDGQWVVQETE